MAAEYGETLSERELEITLLVAEGLTNREVAERLFVSHNTIKVHLRNIFTKTGVASRTELSMLAVQEGWITVPTAADETSNGGHGAEGTAPPQVETQAEASPSALLPAWPWQRWVAMAFGTLLALLVLLLPQRRVAPTSATGPGNL